MGWVGQGKKKPQILIWLTINMAKPRNDQMLNFPPPHHKKMRTKKVQPNLTKPPIPCLPTGAMCLCQT